MREGREWLLVLIPCFYSATFVAWLVARPILRFTTSPISLLIDIVRDEIDRGWEALRDSASGASTLGRAPFLRALRYLGAYDHLTNTQATISTRHRESTRTPPSRVRRLDPVERLITALEPFAPLFEFLGVLVMVLGAALAVAALVYWLLHLPELVQQFLELLPDLLRAASWIVFGYGAIYVLTNWFARRFISSRGHRWQYVLDGSNISPWRYSVHKYDHSEESSRVQAMLNQSEGSADPTLPVSADPDSEPANLRTSPVTPGISEIVLGSEAVLATHGKTINGITRRLNNVVALHKILAVITSAGFLVSMGIAAYVILHGSAASLKLIVGSTGMGAVLGTFTYRLLKNVRTANISVALFESFLAELHQNLSEAEQTTDPSKRRERRAAGWFEFRKGLNALWRTEGR